MLFALTGIDVAVSPCGVVLRLSIESDDALAVRNATSPTFHHSADSAEEIAASLPE